ncbi:MAG TPA: NHL repeat-containing protein [Planctomycetota bacterium]|nr:NHL repeat-containing protein [Planctomycetota bacterium]
MLHLAHANPAPEHFGALVEAHIGLRASAVAFDAHDRLWVADTGNHRLICVAPDGTRRELGARGQATGRFLRPAGIACGPDGRVYVADTGNHRVQVLDRDGTPLFAFGARGRGAGELCEPLGIAVDARRVLVADSGNARVACFTLDGTPLEALDAHGELERPEGVALDPLARVWVADAGRERLVRLDATGAVERALGLHGRRAGQFAEPAGLGFVGARLFVAERGNHRVQEFDASGESVGTFPRPAYAPHGEPGGLFAPAGLAVSPDGTRIAVCEPLEDRVQVFGEAVESDAAHDDHSQSETLAWLAPGADGDGRLTLWIDPGLRSVRVLRDEGVGQAPLTELGTRGGAGFAFDAPCDAALDGERGRIHVADGARVWTFELRAGALERGLDVDAGRLVRYVELEAQRAVAGVALEWPARADALVALPDGGLVVADARNRCLLRLDARGALRESWDLADAGGLLRPVELVHAGGRLYVCDADRGVVHVLDLAGRPLARLAHDGTRPLVEPWGVLPLDDGRVFVSDRAGDRVHVFDAHGVRTATFGSSGGGPGELRQPTTLLPSAAGFLRVLDTGNRRAQVLTLEGDFVLSLG